MLKKRAWHEQEPRGARALKGVLKALVGIGLPLAVVLAVITANTSKPAEQPPPPRLASAVGVSVDEGATLDGAWVLDDGWVGYRILEDLPRLRGKHEAVGRTHVVSGGLQIEGSTLHAGVVEADLDELTSDQEWRDRVLVHRYLETGEHPTASFRLTEPLTLIALPAAGEVVGLTVPGELTLHGVTRPVQAALDVLWTGGRLRMVGGLHVVLADHEIRPPRISGFRLVDPEGDIELDLTFVPAG
jgi:polyisoprenoid-binding protein YceI